MTEADENKQAGQSSSGVAQSCAQPETAFDYGDVLTALQVRTHKLEEIRQADSLEEASRLAGEALCIGPGKKAILEECRRYDTDE